jgi:hypothetical protein
MRIVTKGAVSTMARPTILSNPTAWSDCTSKNSTFPRDASVATANSRNTFD